MLCSASSLVCGLNFAPAQKPSVRRKRASVKHYVAVTREAESGLLLMNRRRLMSRNDVKVPWSWLKEFENEGCCHSPTGLG
jgi:hypothetical protein